MANAIAILPARFWLQVDQDGPVPEYRPELGPCWLWPEDKLDAAGYGERFQINGERDYPHRWSYRNLVGPIPDELEIDHLCRVRHCVHPDHLEVVTHGINQERMAAARTHCKWGHPLSGENLRIDPKTGGRVCRACNKQRQRDFHARRLKEGVTPAPDARCKYGHPYEVDSKGRWFCRECGRKRAREWKQRQRRSEGG